MPLLGAFIVPHPPIIVPQVGRGEEEKIAATAAAYREVARRITALAPQTIVVCSPHATAYADYFHISPGAGARGDFGRFGAPGCAVEVAYDAALVRALEGAAAAAGLPAGTLGEREGALDHGTLIPLLFIREQYTAFQVVRIGLSGLPPLEHYRLGALLAQVCEDLGRRAVLVASGDLSHKLKEEGPYGFAPAGPLFDAQVRQAMEEGDFLRFLTFEEGFCNAAAECGLRSFQILAGSLDGRATQAQLLSYEGPFGVGYAVAAFSPGAPDEGRRFGEVLKRRQAEKAQARRRAEDPYVRLARLALETYVKTGQRAALPADLPAPLRQERAGVFVSLKKGGRLRGCIGTIGPATGCVGEEILRNAVCAGCEDPRFPPVEAGELEALTYSVDVLGPPEPISALSELDPSRYGVIVTHGRRRGLLLPQLEGVDTAERQVAIAREKAGIGPEEPCGLERFEVVRHL